MENTEKKWVLSAQNPDLCSKLSQTLNISQIVAQVLINRGIETPEQAQLFLSARLQDLHSPFLMKGMEKAVGRIVAAIKNNEKICIYGDFDVDGITSTAVMVLFLREVNVNVSFYIPKRLKEGYGLNVNAVKKIKERGTSLLITVDCGISDVNAVKYANSNNMDVIVTDHHEMPDNYAEAYAILNPKQPDCGFPFKGLAGVGVAFNLVIGLRKRLRELSFWQKGEEPNLKDYLDLVALGTIADIVPMIDENRIFAKNGLKVLAKGKRPGIKALKDVSGIPDGPVDSSMVAFRLAPRMNASGRLSNAEDVVELLISTTLEEANILAKKIDEENTQRQKIGRKILADAKSKVVSKEDFSGPLVLSSEDWHQGVIGICASRLSDEFFTPTVLLAIDKETGEARGSARSISGFDIYSAIKKCGSDLKAFGGHKAAAGLTLSVDKVDSFREKFTKIVRAELEDKEFVPIVEINAEIPLDLLTYGILQELENLSPFGPANPEPVFSSCDINYYSSMTVGNGHLKLKIKEDGQFFDAIGFNMASRYCLKDETIRLAFVPQIHSYNGEKNIQLNLKDIKYIDLSSAANS